MKRLESNLLNMALSLTLISLVAAGALGGIYMLTKEPIEKTNEANKLKAKTDVLPQVQNVTFAEPDTVTLEDGYLMVVYQALDAESNAVGAAVETADKNGFNGLIRLMVGFDAQGVIQGYSVLEQGETPGLGANMVNWFKTDKNKQSVVGLNPETAKLQVSKDGGDVDAITAATISSRAFLRAVQRAYNAYKEQAQKPVDALSGATALAVPDSLAADSAVAQEVEAEQPAQPELAAEIQPAKPVETQQAPQSAKKTAAKPVVKEKQPASAKAEEPKVEQPQTESQPAAATNDSAK